MQIASNAVSSLLNIFISNIKIKNIKNKKKKNDNTKINMINFLSIFFNKEKI